MKTLLVAEHMHPPYDEGMKAFALRLLMALLEESEVRVVRDIKWLPAMLNRILLVPRCQIAAVLFRPDRIVYVPRASLTYLSFRKADLIQRFTRCGLTLVGLQRRAWSARRAERLAELAPERVWVWSERQREDLERVGVEARVLPPAVDVQRFKPSTERKALRKRLGLEGRTPMLLHVGHLKRERNVDWLAEIARALPDWRVVLVASTTTHAEAGVREELEQAGVRVLHEFRQDIAEVYQAADAYCFPVQDDEAATEVPLSVLEAMAVGLPVVSTRFGRLPEIFEEDRGLRYVDDWRDAVEVLREGSLRGQANRAKTMPWSWEALAERLLEDKGPTE